MPPPGSNRWDTQTLAATAARYNGFDVSPYSSAATGQPCCSQAASPVPGTFSAEAALSWHSRGWVVLNSPEPLWPTDMLDAAAQAAEAVPIPGCESTKMRLRPNGAMSGPPLVDTSPFMVEEGDATVVSLGELPFESDVDALGFAPSAVVAVAKMMDCLPDDVRLCRSELVAIIPRDYHEDTHATCQGSCAVRLWHPQQYSLLSSTWDAQRRSDGVACMLIHEVPRSSNFSFAELTIETDGVSRKTGGRNIAALYDVTQHPHIIRMPYACRKPLRCSILFWRRRDADWVGWEVWGKKLSGYARLNSPTMDALQRSLLGWPAVGSEYWQNKLAFDSAADRYGRDVMALYKARM